MLFNRVILSTIAAVTFSLPAISQASVTYNYTGLAFTVVDSWLYTNGNLLGNKNVFSFTFDNAFGANLNMQSVGGLVKSWEASTLNTPRSKIGSAITNSTVNTLNISTDATGKITDWSINLAGYTDDIYHNGILGKEVISASKGTDAIAFYNPPGYRSWPYRADGSYGYAYCMGFSCVDANPSWQMTQSPAPVPVPAAAWLLGSGLLGLIGIARRTRSC